MKNVITNKLKNKIIILDNASSHRNAKIKELIAKNNTLLYSVPYQHYTNAIENFFSLLKSEIRKMEGLSYNKLLENIRTTIREIPKLRYENILKGVYKRPEIYVPKVKQRKRTIKNYR